MTLNLSSIQQYISGRWRDGGSATTIETFEPYSGAALSTIRGASCDDVDEAFAAAAAAQKLWAEYLPQERSAILQKAAAAFEARHDEIVGLLIHEAGSTHYWAEMISRHAALCCSEAAGYAQTELGTILPSLLPGQASHVYRRPAGIVAVITSWNSPVNLTTRAIAPALALGNAVVLKPANETPVSGGLIHAEIFASVGLPAGLLNVVVGASNEIGDHFTSHPSADVVSFTGSTRVGRHIIQQNANASRIKRLGLELGGNAPFVVLDDADLTAAADAIIYGRFLHQGQICMSVNRVLASAKIHDELVDLLEPRIRELPYGNPSDPRTVVGPLINAQACQGVVAKIERAKAQGATMLVGGAPQGNVVPPHMFVGIERDHDLPNEEIFGPVLPILMFETDEDAITIANATEYGLASSVFTQDRSRGERFANAIRAGMTSINDQTVLTDIYGPFGGEKNSGVGRFNGQWIIEEFTRPHWITTQTSRRAYSF